MIRFLYGDSLADHSRLAQSMFRDRAKQFSERLGWEVSVDDAGEERDQYDALNPLYVIWQRPDGLHGGSMRFLPTTGRCMTHEHFLHLSGGTPCSKPVYLGVHPFLPERECESNNSGTAHACRYCADGRSEA
jgi:acyl homoserine lactone synthase